MGQEIARELAELETMTTGQLCERYVVLYGQPVRTRHRAYLVRKVAWRIQALAEGDLSERARRRAEELANDADVRVMAPKSTPKPKAPAPRTSTSNDPRLPAIGTALVRQYKGRTVRVVVLGNGLEYQGERYNTLTAVAEAITGSHINGFRFFRLEAKP